MQHPWEILNYIALVTKRSFYLHPLPPPYKIWHRKDGMRRSIDSFTCANDFCCHDARPWVKRHRCTARQKNDEKYYLHGAVSELQLQAESHNSPHFVDCRTGQHFVPSVMCARFWVESRMLEGLSSVSVGVNTLRTGLLNCLNARSRGLTFRHRASCI